MEVPGEKLLIKLWDTLIDRGVGGLLKPWQIRRENRAKLEGLVHEKVALAEAERIAEKVRRGELELGAIPGIEPLALSAPTAAPLQLEHGAAASTSTHLDPVAVAQRVQLADTIRNEVNVAKAILVAENELEQSTAAEPDKSIDVDWLYRWRDYAGAASAENLQFVWGKILAGEVKAPGKYSLRLLEFVRCLDQSDAQVIERIAPMVLVRSFIFNEKQGAPYPVSFADILHLEAIGIVVAAAGPPPVNALERNSDGVTVWDCHNRAIVVRSPTTHGDVGLPSTQLTQLGSDVPRLGEFKADEEYLRTVAKYFKGMQGVEAVLIGDYEVSDDGSFRVTNLEDVN